MPWDSIISKFVAFNAVGQDVKDHRHLIGSTIIRAVLQVNQCRSHILSIMS